MTHSFEAVECEVLTEPVLSVFVHVAVLDMGPGGRRHKVTKRLVVIEDLFVN